jgi:hypothetical protein
LQALADFVEFNPQDLCGLPLRQQPCLKFCVIILLSGKVSEGGYRCQNEIEGLYYLCVGIRF